MSELSYKKRIDGCVGGCRRRFLISRKSSCLTYKACDQWQDSLQMRALKLIIPTEWENLSYGTQWLACVALHALLIISDGGSNSMHRFWPNRVFISKSDFLTRWSDANQLFVMSPRTLFDCGNLSRLAFTSVILLCRSLGLYSGWVSWDGKATNWPVPFFRVMLVVAL